MDHRGPVAGVLVRESGGEVDAIGDEPVVYDARHALEPLLSRKRLCSWHL